MLKGQAYPSGHNNDKMTICDICRMHTREREREKTILKGQLKVKINNFSNIFFWGKPDKSKDKFVELFALLYCSFARKLCSKLGFCCFCGLFIVGSKTKL